LPLLIEFVLAPITNFSNFKSLSFQDGKRTWWRNKSGQSRGRRSRIHIFDSTNDTQ